MNDTEAARVVAGMTKHGIDDSKANYWIHLFPFERPPSDPKGHANLYWYNAALMREFILLTNPPIILGNSKNKQPTGAGYLISKECHLVQRNIVPAKYVNQFYWDDYDATDRLCGLWGQHIVWSLLQNGILRLPTHYVTSCRAKRDQFTSVDLIVTQSTETRWEIKTETFEKSPNIFVQTHERGHKATLTKDGRTNYTEMPPFEDGSV